MKFAFYGQPKNQPWSKYSNNTASSWWSDPGLRLSVFMVCSIFMVQATDGYDKSLSSSVQALKPWVTTMGSPGATTLGLMNSGVALGGLLFAVPAGYISDKWGRRAGIFFGTILFLVGSVMTSAANNFAVFCGGRVIIGAGIAASLTCAPILCQEIAHPRMRGVVGSLYNVMFNVGAIFVTYIAYGTSYLGNTSQWTWRIPAMIQVVPSLYVLCVLPFLPESPRWLVSKGREEEAHTMLAKYHANDKMDDELVVFELNEIKEVIALESQSNPGWLHCFETPGNRKRFLLLTLVSIITNWNGKAIVTYYFAAAVKLVGITDAHAVTGLNAGVNVFNLVGTIIGAGVANSVGRRKLWLTAFIWMVGANIIQTVCSAVYANSSPKNQLAAQGTIAGLLLYSFGFDLACNPLLFTYEVEVMPYYLRSKGLAYGVTLNNIQGVAIQYINPIGLANLGWKFYLIYLALLLVFVVIIYLFFPETGSKTLEEVSHLFDGKQSMLEIRAAADRLTKHVEEDEESANNTPDSIEKMKIDNRAGIPTLDLDEKK